MVFSLTDGIVLAMFLISLSAFFIKPTLIYLKLFPVYFMSSFLTGLATEYLQQHGRVNTVIYNIWGTIEFCFYFFVLRQIIVSIEIRRVILYLLFLYPLVSFNFIYFQRLVGFNPINYTVGTLITVVLCMYYFIEVFGNIEAKSFFGLPAFWIVSAIFINNVLAFPTFALFSFMKNLPKLIVNNIAVIFYIINSLVLILYSIGFLCRIRINKSTL
jgi:hypothetical protein